MDVWHSIILGLVEGVTEFLPISSTGHLILTASLLGITQTDFTKTFEIAIQLGAILAVVVLYWKSLLDLSLLKKIVVAFIPTGIIGFALYTVVRDYLLGNEVVVLAALFLGGVLLIVFELWHKKQAPEAEASLTELTYRQAAFVGIFQAFALVPGVSRSGASIMGGLALKIPRSVIVEFSFLLAVPTILAATGLSLLSTSDSFTPHEWLMLGIGFLVSFLAALPAVKWLLAYVRKHSFIPFGIYRIVLSIVFGAYLFL